MHHQSSGSYCPYIDGITSNAGQTPCNCGFQNQSVACNSNYCNQALWTGACSATPIPNCYALTVNSTVGVTANSTACVCGTALCLANQQCYSFIPQQPPNVLPTQNCLNTPIGSCPNQNGTVANTNACTCGSGYCIPNQQCNPNVFGLCSMIQTPTCASNIATNVVCACGTTATCTIGQICSPTSSTPCNSPVVPVCPGSSTLVSTQCTCGSSSTCSPGQQCNPSGTPACTTPACANTNGTAVNSNVCMCGSSAVCGAGRQCNSSLVIAQCGTPMGSKMTILTMILTLV